MAVRPAVPRVLARGAILLTSLIGLAIGFRARAEVVRIEPARDNTLFAGAEGASSGSGPALFAGRTSQGLVRRALLRFDVAARLPQEARIDSVVLALHVSNGPNGIPRRFTLHRLRAPWGEGDSYASGGAGALAAPGDATWTCAFFPDRPWSTPGGDFDPEAHGSVLIEGVDTYRTGSTAITADVQDWRDRPDANFGWLLQGEETSSGTARRFDSRECDREEDRPALLLYYSLDRVPPAMTWGGVRTRYR